MARRGHGYAGHGGWAVFGHSCTVVSAIPVSSGECPPRTEGTAAKLDDQRPPRSCQRTRLVRVHAAVRSSDRASTTWKKALSRFQDHTAGQFLRRSVDPERI